MAAIDATNTTGASAGNNPNSIIYFVLHYLQPTTFANAAFTVDGTLAGVTFIRVAGEQPQLDEIDVADEMAGIERGIIAHEEAAKCLERLNNAFSSIPTCVAKAWAAACGAVCRSISPHGTWTRFTCTPIPTAM